MAIPSFAGYGYTAGANRARHAQSLGQFAGMNLENMAYFGHGHVHGLTGIDAPGTRYQSLTTVGSARGFQGAPVPQLRSYGAPVQRPVAGVDALRFQGQPTGYGVRGTTPVSAATRAAAVNARSQLWQQARDAWKGPEPEAAVEPTPGFKAINARPPLPGTQLALEKGATPMGPSGWTTGGKLFEMPPEAPGAPIPSTRAPRNRRSAFAPNQGTLDL